MIRFALLYAAAAGAAVGAGCLIAGWEPGSRLGGLVSLVLVSSFVAAVFSWLAATWVTGRRPATARFAGMLIALTLSTAGFTALFFFLQSFFQPGRHHAPFFSRSFAIEVFFTALSMTYLFAVTGLRLFLPFGLVVLLAASFAFARLGEL